MEVLSTMRVFSTMGDIMCTMGDILSTIEGYLESAWRDILSTMKGVQYHGDIVSTVGGYLEYRGGYHEYHGGYRVPWGCSVPWGISWVPWRVFSTVGEIFCYLSAPWCWTPHGTHDIPHIPPWYSWYFPTCIMISPRYSRYPPHLSWYLPTVLKISPYGTHDIPHSTEHPHSTAHRLYRMIC